MWKKIVALVAVAAMASLLAYGFDGTRGLEGAGIGILIGLVMGSVGSALLAWARRARGNALLLAMFGGVAASFALMLGAMLALAAFRQDLLTTASLTALSLYLVSRFFEAFQAASLASRAGGCP